DGHPAAIRAGIAKRGSHASAPSSARSYDKVDMPEDKVVKYPNWSFPQLANPNRDAQQMELPAPFSIGTARNPTDIAAGCAAGNRKVPCGAPGYGLSDLPCLQECNSPGRSRAPRR